MLIPVTLDLPIRRVTEHLSTISAQDKKQIMTLLRTPCDKCTMRLTLPFKLHLFSPDGKDALYDNVLALEHEGVPIYFHERCYAADTTTAKE